MSRREETKEEYLLWQLMIHLENKITNPLEDIFARRDVEAAYQYFRESGLAVGRIEPYWHSEEWRKRNPEKAPPITPNC